MKSAVIVLCTIATGWILGWINRGMTYKPSDVIPFSIHFPHSTIYEGLFFVALVLFVGLVGHLPRLRPSLRHVAKNVRPLSFPLGVLKIAIVGLLLGGAAEVGRNARIPYDFFELPVLEGLSYFTQTEVAQLLSTCLVLGLIYTITALIAADLRREEAEKLEALSTAFALEQRRKGIPVPLPGEIPGTIPPPSGSPDPNQTP